MNIYVIDDSGELSSELLMAEAELDFFEDEVEALHAVQRLQPSLLLLRYGQRRQQTPSYIRALLQASPLTHIVVVGDEVSDDMICECLLAGAHGYQNQTQLNRYFKKMIRVVEQGEAWVSRKLVAHLLNSLIRHQRFDMPMAIA